MTMTDSARPPRRKAGGRPPIPQERRLVAAAAFVSPAERDALEDIAWREQIALSQLLRRAAQKLLAEEGATP